MCAGQLPQSTSYQHSHAMPAEAFSDLWICSNCGAENHNWCTECPLCGHAKDNTQAPNDYDDLWICPECGAENLDCYDHCPLCPYIRSTTGMMQAGEANDYNGICAMKADYGVVMRGPAPGVWVCTYCGCSNSAVHGNQCGACGEVN
jgi:hypothetical protein